MIEVTQRQLSIHINGMTCAACSSRVEKVLNKIDSVDAKVNLATETVKVSYEAEAVSPSDVIHKIKSIGYDVETEKIELTIYGMTCAACANRIEKELQKLTGISEAAVNLANETATVTFYPDVLDDDDIIQQIKGLGYDADRRKERGSKDSHKQQEIKKMRMKLIISALLSIPLLITMLDHLFGMSIPSILMNPWFQFALATPVQFIIGWQFYVSAYKNLKTKSANMDVLVALGTSAAYFYSLYEAFRTIGDPSYIPHLYFETSAILITLILFGKYLETNAKGRTT